MGNDYKRAPVRVWNDSDADYKENYQGEEIVIKAKGFITMGRSKAANFIGSMSPAVPQSSQNKIARAEKKLRMELIGPIEPPKEQFKSMVDGTVFETKAELEEYDKKFSSQQIKDETETEKEPASADTILCPICRKPVKGKLGLKIHLGKDKCGA